MVGHRYRWLLYLSLLAVIITGGIIAWQRYRPPHPVEIILAPALGIDGEVYVLGNVDSPGIYPLRGDDTIEDLLQAAGGRTDGPATGQFYVYIGHGADPVPQKVDINCAPDWLLEALPGVGPVLSRAIIDYRLQNGGFKVITEITQVEGISKATYEGIKDYITVGDWSP
jgi:competence protein ComEA